MINSPAKGPNAVSQATAKPRMRFGLNRGWCRLAGGVLAVGWAWLSAGFSAGEVSPQAMRDDASLADVCFVDAENGWAVGDRGAIWKTRDGGTHWQLLESGVTCRLNSVQFIDLQHGYAAGGGTEPFSLVSQGVLLRTRDAGRTWQAIKQQGMGAILRLKFVDARRGWALCLPNGLCGSGLLTTDDGGQDWTPLAQRTLHTWSCGDVIHPQRGVVAVDGDVAATIRGRDLHPGQVDFGLRRPAAVRLSASGLGVLVGEGGLLRMTQDGGAQWTHPSGALPAIASDLSLHAAAIRGDRIWVAGSPGAVVLRSTDRGNSWEVCSTGVTLPIHALSFVDDERGWAVGAMGQILATTDGGRTWTAQRGAGHRAAFLGLFAEVDDVPLEMLAKLSAGEGYRGVVSVLARRDLESPIESPLTIRTRQREALLHAGVGEVMRTWSFPLRQRGIPRSERQIIEDWQRVTGAREPCQQLVAHLAREIRCWRPEVVVTQAVPRQGDSPLAKVIHEAVLAAAKQAAEPADRDVHARSGLAALPPWRVRRVIAALGEGERGSISLAGTQILPQLGCSLAEYTVVARGLLTTDLERELPTASFTVAWDQAPQEDDCQDFFSGLNLPAPSAARRPPLPEAAVSLDQLRRMAQRRQTLQAIVAHQTRIPIHRAAWLAQIGTLTRDLDDQSASLLLYHLACQYRRSGHDELAAETLAQIAENHSAPSGLAAAASLWLVQYYASGEWTVRADRAGRLPRQLAHGNNDRESAAGMLSGTGSLIPVTDGNGSVAGSQAGVQQVAGELPPEGAAEARRTLAQQWFQKLQAGWPSLAAEPRAVLPAARALADMDGGAPAQRLTLGLTRSRAADAWSLCAASEQWLTQSHASRNERSQSAEAPKAVWHCRRTTAKPRLDGRLDDVCWRGSDENPGSAAISLRSAVGDDSDWPAAVQMAYDKEFLYLVVTCRKAPGVEYGPAAKGPRPRDADLSGQDHVALLLDIDRDWTTYWRLRVDHRGLTAEDCWGDPTWNPKWFVAGDSDETTWTCEAAIPWNELTRRAPQPGEAWAAGVQRLAPGAGFQSWTTPASAATMRPEGFGLLVFE